MKSEILTIRSLIDWRAETGPDLPFLISPETGRVLTFQGLQKQAIELCAQLRQLGLEPGDKIAFLLDNGLFTGALFLGAMYGGFVSVPFNVRAGVSQLAGTLDHSDAKIVFTGCDYGNLIKEVMVHVQRQTTVTLCGPDNGPANQPASVSIPLAPVESEDAALIMYTSGSTGQPKGVVHTHRSLLAHGRNSVASHKLTATDRSLLVLPLYHINAECVTLIPTLLSGGAVIVPHHFNVSQFWDWIDEHRCTWSALVPTIISQLLDWKDPKAESRAAAFKRIRFLRSSSAPLSPSLHQDFLRKFELPLIQAMGCTELGNVFSNPVPPGTNKIGSPGLPWGIEAKIVKRDGVELPAGEPGEILLRGDAMMQGYYKDPVGTATAVDADGWLHTGDLAYRDGDGYFFVVGRSKELIIKGGMNIAPRQIDEILETHPDVLEAAAVGIPDRYLGEDVVAFAVLRRWSSCEEKELLSFCESRLGYFRTPTRIYFVQDLPKGPSGKVQRLRLIEEATKPGPLDGEAGTHCVSGNGAPNGSPATDVSIEQIIAEIWSDLLTRPKIDIQSNFFSLGGYSLLAIQCLSRLRGKVPVMLSLSDFFENATIAQLATLTRERLRSASAQDANNSSHGDAEPIPLRDRTLPCPLSPSQERFWFLEQLNPGVPVYNEAEAVRLKGKLDTEALEKALNISVARHEILRSTIEVVNEEPIVVVHESRPLKLKLIDLSGWPAEQREAELERLLVDEPRRLYDLRAEPGIRATLIKLAAEEHAFILMMHHIICDRSSLGVLWHELRMLYEKILIGEPFSLPSLPIQYGDYSAWQRRQSRQASFERDLSFWKKYLRGAPALLDLPADRPRPGVLSHRGKKRCFLFGSALATKLRDLGRREKTSLFNILVAALNTVLYRYSGQEDILVGIPIADRVRPELQPLIGCLIDTLVLRTDLSGNLSFRELLSRVQRSLVDVYSHKDVPFEQVLKAVALERNLSYSPLFQVMFNWRDRDAQLQFVGLPGLDVEPLLAQCETCKYDLTFNLTDAIDDILIEVEYSTDLFDEDRIERMIGHYLSLLGAAAAHPNRRLADLALLTDAERHQILVEWNETKTEYPKERYLHELIEEQVRHTPDAVAVVAGDKSLTYGALNARANQLARHLKALGIGPDKVVGVCMGRSLDMIVGFLGILKAGGAYLPLDPAYPKERLAFMLSDAGVEVLLTHRSLCRGARFAGPRCNVFCLDSDWAGIEGISTDNLKNEVSVDDLAYVIYTSGSTGEPKGVELRHGGLLNLVFWHRRTYQVTASDRATQLAGVGFDASVWEVWPYLSSGASIHMPEEETRLSPDKLRDWLIERKITLSFVPTPLAEAIVGLPWPSKVSLRAMLTGGDRLTRHRPLSLPFSLVNHYGPTENTVVTTCAIVGSEVDQTKAPPIGRPIDNTQVYLLDAHLEPVPIGVPGELYIGGAGLARGYYHRPDLTAEKFIANPFSAERGARMYKTGDLACYLPTGMIHFLGRNDAQIKIRGFRIELGEIESVLGEHPGIGSAVVISRGDAPEDKRLVAYVTLKTADLAGGELREYLKRKMPDYMVPSVFVALDRLPLTSNGKVDRAALPAPDSAKTLQDEAGVAPLTGTEKIMAGILASLLKLNKVTVDREANFFDLGGHSLLGTQLIARIRDRFGIELPLYRIFESPTIASLSAEIEEILVARAEPMSEEEVRSHSMAQG